MARYFIQRTHPRAWVGDDDAWEAGAQDHVPSVCDHEATDTGLLDVNGDAIMRAPNPVGFCKDDEW